MVKANEIGWRGDSRIVDRYITASERDRSECRRAAEQNQRSVIGLFTERSSGAEHVAECSFDALDIGPIDPPRPGQHGEPIAAVGVELRSPTGVSDRFDLDLRAPLVDQTFGDAAQFSGRIGE